jgi:response regulator NasT
MNIVPGPKIIVADSKLASRNSIKEILLKSGYRTCADADNFPDLLRKARSMHPDLVIIDAELAGGSVYEIAAILEHDNIANVLIIADEFRSRQLRDYPHIRKPISEDAFISVVEVCLLYANKISAMRTEMDQVKRTLDDRRIIEKAKGILMHNLGLTESEAYRRIQKLSMDKSISMKEIAKRIVENEGSY